MTLHYVRDGAIVASDLKEIRAAIARDFNGKQVPWLESGSVQDQRSVNVYREEPVGTGYFPPPMFTDVVDGPPTFDPVSNRVTVEKTLQEWSLERAQKHLFEALARNRWEAEMGGFTGSTGMFHNTDDRTRTALNLAMIEIANGRTTPVIWKSRVNGEDTFVSLGVAEITAIHGAVRQHIEDCFLNEQVLTTQINAAADVADLRAIDIEAGWP